MLLQLSILVSLAGPIAGLQSAEPKALPAVRLDVPEGAHEPQAAVLAKGDKVCVVYATKDRVWCSTSLDAGATFGSPLEVGGVGKLSLGMRRGPRVSFAKESLVITAIGGEKGGGQDGDVVCWRAKGPDSSWTGPVRVNDVAGSAREGLHAMASDENDEVFCAWIDLRDGKPEVWGALSSDGGKKWDANVRVYKSPQGEICPCCHPSVAFDAQGAIHVMWRNALDGARDMYTSLSRDGGKTFERAAKEGRGSWKLPSCPMDGGELIGSARQESISVWRRDEEVFRCKSGQAEELLGRGQQPWIAAGPDGAFILWTEKRGGALRLLAPTSEKSVELAASAIDAMVAGTIDGKGPVTAVWETEEDGHSRIFAARVDRSR